MKHSFKHIRWTLVPSLLFVACVSAEEDGITEDGADKKGDAAVSLDGASADAKGDAKGDAASGLSGDGSTKDTGVPRDASASDAKVALDANVPIEAGPDANVGPDASLGVCGVCDPFKGTGCGANQACTVQGGTTLCAPAASIPSSRLSCDVAKGIYCADGYSCAGGTCYPACAWPAGVTTKNIAKHADCLGIPGYGTTCTAINSCLGICTNTISI
ncbi:MAG: hypothetical protein KBF88_11980 [Polyangiaceae bacterium]|nr:hypothetical protein [Polyangiaceae bacterium]